VRREAPRSTMKMVVFDDEEEENKKGWKGKASKA